MELPPQNRKSLHPMPFFFRKLDAIDKYIATNICGSYALLDSREELENVVFSRTDKLSSGRLDELTAKSFLATECEYKSRLSLVGSKYASILNGGIIAPGLFLVNPTLRCDHDCKYCQVSRVGVAKSGFDIAESSIDKIVSIIDEIPNREIKIEFQGGEPLLEFYYIKKFVDKAEKALGDRKVSYVICTASGPMNEEVVNWARDHNVVFSTSLDGPKFVHDFNRPAREFSAYDNTITWIKRLQESLGQHSVGCLATVTRKGLEYPIDTVREYFNLDLEGVFLRPLSPFGFASTLWDRLGYSAKEFFLFYKAALDEVIRLNEFRTFVEEMALVHLRKIFRAGTSGYADLKSPSGYLMGGMSFNYDGNVFGSDESRMLWESTKARELVLGTIDDSAEKLLTNINAIEVLSDTIVGTTPGCDECAYQPYCGADPLFHLATQGDHIGDKSKSFFCQLERMLFDHLFCLYDTSDQARKVFDQWLCLSE
ncbi:MAG: His-Xaa-Ser system radical SAM maturase HxsB [gamma proteobacterium symbiont of Clathrolucina costata]